MDILNEEKKAIKNLKKTLGDEWKLTEEQKDEFDELVFQVFEIGKKEAKAQTTPQGFGDIQSWIAVKSFSALDASIVDFPVVDANELAEFIDSLNIDLVVPEGFVLVPKEPTEVFKEHLKNHLFDLWAGDHGCDWDGFVDVDAISHNTIWKMMIEAQEQSHD